MNPFTDFFASSFHCMLDSKSCSAAADSYLCFAILSFPQFDKLKAIEIEELFNFRNLAGTCYLELNFIEKSSSFKIIRNFGCQSCLMNRLISWFDF